MFVVPRASPSVMLPGIMYRSLHRSILALVLCVFGALGGIVDELLRDFDFEPVQRQQFSSGVSDRGLFLSRPVVLHVGPLFDAGFDQQAASPLTPEDIFANSGFFGHSFQGIQHDIFEQGIQHDLFELLDAQMKHSHVGNGFHVEQQGGRFRLRASLPGYRMHTKAHSGEEEAQPLSVEVIGRSLVVRGEQNDGRVLRSFQRSFRLPTAANPDGIEVTYNVTDGALAVDIPAQVGTSDRDHDGEHITLGSQDEGSDTTFTISSGDEANAFPMLRDTPGGLPSLLDSFFGTIPFEGRATSGFLAHVEGNQRASQSAGSQSAVRPINDVLPFDFSHSKSPKMSNEKTPLVVQRKDAKPFWRLANHHDGQGSKSIEIVVPDGARLGELHGKHIPFYGKSEGELELPVAINSGDCDTVNVASSSERVVQCKVEDSTVRKLPIKVIEEL